MFKQREVSFTLWFISNAAIYILCDRFTLLGHSAKTCVQFLSCVVVRCEQQVFIFVRNKGCRKNTLINIPVYKNYSPQNLTSISAGTHWNLNRCQESKKRMWVYTPNHRLSYLKWLVSQWQSPILDVCSQMKFNPFLSKKLCTVLHPVIQF